VVSKPQNPDWTWDEELLVFDVYLKLGCVGRKHPAVIELSAILRSLPIHPEDTRAETFRNTNGVERKLGDIHTHRPGYTGRPTRGSTIDSDVWTKYGDAPDLVHQLAGAIRAGAFTVPTPEDDELDIEKTHSEGRIAYRVHRRRERDPKLRERKRAAVRKEHGSLRCEACSANLKELYGTDAADVYECHHLIPLHASGEVETTLGDVALLCPTCHRIAHRISPWPDLTTLRALRASD
jgi:5-methylcytosine-specific restriction protein A